MARLGWRWFKQGRYWFAFETVEDGHAVTAVIYERANIPDRL